MIYYEDNYLMHHGILGQKWGVRRYQNPDGTLTTAGQKRYYGKADRIQRDIDSFKGHESGIRTKSGRLLLSSDDVKNAVKGLESVRDKERSKGDARRQRDAKKIENSMAKKSAKIDAVRKYDKAYDKAYKTQEIADEANAKMKAAYKDLGRTGVSRFFQAFKGTIGKGNDAYNRYSKAFDKANATQDAADEAHQKMRSAYQSTGKNYVDRVLNNIKYGE